MSTSIRPEQGMHYINGAWVAGTGKPFTSLNPATQACLWQGQIATSSDVASACHAAQAALPVWSALSLAQRIKYCEAFAEQIQRQLHDLTALIAQESGKPLWEAKTEAQAVVAKIALAIQAYHERTPEQRLQTSAGITQAIRYKPQGVMAIIGPFNFPAHLANAHIVPALLAGNTIVYKPSELTPAVAQFITQAWHTIGLPNGVLNCLQGDASSAQHLINQDIQAVAFTGSYKTGLAIHQQLANRPEVLLAMEMGGNNPFVVDEISNITAGVYQLLLSSFITAGQRCTCARRAFIPDNALGDDFLTKLVQATAQLRIGNPEETPEPFLGPVISPAHATMHLKAQQDLIDHGGVSVLPMQLIQPDSGFLSPGIMDVTSIAAPADHEIFAPFVQITRYHTFSDAIAMANQSQYGLSSALLSDNASHYQEFYQHIKAGIVYWNLATTGTSLLLPFGGVGHSGNHRPSGYYAADYCAYPVAGQESEHLTLPDTMLPGIIL